MMKKYYYADVLPDGRVRACLAYDGPEEGPIEPHWESQQEGQIMLLEQPIVWAGPTETSVLYMVDGTQVWRESLPLADVIARARDTMDAAGEALRQAVVSKRPLKGDEYAQAEAQARAWQAADFAGDVPEDVLSWADAKHREEMTPLQAAHDILHQAAQYRGLLSGIRRLRLKYMEDVKHADTSDACEAAVEEFSAQLRTLAGSAT